MDPVFGNEDVQKRVKRSRLPQRVTISMRSQPENVQLLVNCATTTAIVSSSSTVAALEPATTSILSSDCHNDDFYEACEKKKHDTKLYKSMKSLQGCSIPRKVSMNSSSSLSSLGHKMEKISTGAFKLSPKSPTNNRKLPVPSNKVTETLYTCMPQPRQSLAAEPLNCPSTCKTLFLRSTASDAQQQQKTIKLKKINNNIDSKIPTKSSQTPTKGGKMSLLPLPTNYNYCSHNKNDAKNTASSSLTTGHLHKKPKKLPVPLTIMKTHNDVSSSNLTISDFAIQNEKNQTSKLLMKGQQDVALQKINDKVDDSSHSKKVNSKEELSAKIKQPKPTSRLPRRTSSRKVKILPSSEPEKVDHDDSATSLSTLGQNAVNEVNPNPPPKDGHGHLRKETTFSDIKNQILNNTSSQVINVPQPELDPTNGINIKNDCPENTEKILSISPSLYNESSKVELSIIEKLKTNVSSNDEIHPFTKEDSLVTLLSHHDVPSLCESQFSVHLETIMMTQQDEEEEPIRKIKLSSNKIKHRDNGSSSSTIIIKDERQQQQISVVPDKQPLIIMPELQLPPKKNSVVLTEECSFDHQNNNNNYTKSLTVIKKDDNAHKIKSSTSLQVQNDFINNTVKFQETQEMVQISESTSLIICKEKVPTIKESSLHTRSISHTIQKCESSKVLVTKESLKELKNVELSLREALNNLEAVEYPLNNVCSAVLKSENLSMNSNSQYQGLLSNKEENTQPKIIHCLTCKENLRQKIVNKNDESFHSKSLHIVVPPPSKIPKPSSSKMATAEKTIFDTTLQRPNRPPSTIISNSCHEDLTSRTNKRRYKNKNKASSKILHETSRIQKADDNCSTLKLTSGSENHFCVEKNRQNVPLNNLVMTPPPPLTEQVANNKKQKFTVLTSSNYAEVLLPCNSSSQFVKQNSDFQQSSSQISQESTENGFNQYNYNLLEQLVATDESVFMYNAVTHFEGQIHLLNICPSTICYRVTSCIPGRYAIIPYYGKIAPHGETFLTVACGRSSNFIRIEMNQFVIETAVVLNAFEVATPYGQQLFWKEVNPDWIHKLFVGRILVLNQFKLDKHYDHGTDEDANEKPCQNKLTMMQNNNTTIKSGHIYGVLIYSTMLVSLLVTISYYFQVPVV